MLESRLLKAFTVAAFSLFGLAGTSTAAEIAPSLIEALSTAAPGEKVPVIVKFRDGQTYGPLAGALRERRKKIVSTLKNRMSDSVDAVSHIISKKRIVHRDLWIINAIAVKADATMVEAFSKTQKVESITLDEALSSPAVSLGAPVEPEWNLSMTGAPGLWSMGITGENVTVATMDTGADLNHPDLNSSWRGGANSWYDPYGEHSSPFDADGHGTMVAGIITGQGSGGTSIGMAPGAKWIGVKIFKDDGYAYLSAIHQGFQWLLDPDGDPSTDDAPQVVNSSWGLGNIGACSTEFENDLQVLNEAGIAAVFASGNYGPNEYTSVSPANGLSSVSAGAVDYTGTIAGFSSRGPSACDGSVYPLLSAPGVDIRTSDLTYGGAMPLSYSVVSGTSFAASHVSGALALLAGAFPTATPNDLVSSLVQSSHDLGQSGADNAYGMGLIQLKPAYDLLAEKFNSPQPAPVIDQDGDGYAEGSDCNDSDPGINPGAQEIKFDGVDQDCNGYDLTIKITRATYSETYKSLRVEATSSLGGNAALTAEGFGPMSWSANLNKWVLTARGAQKPAEVIVSGPEGSEVFVFSQPAPQPVPEPTPLPVPAPQPGPDPATDQDSDGFASGSDCNDNDPAIHPGATEVIYDGIDQDCNGFDLTIKVIRATYSSAFKSLRVEATSSLGANANLAVEGFGPMSWSPNLRKWVLTARTAQKPAEVVVTGVEGTVRAGVN